MCQSFSCAAESLHSHGLGGCYARCRVICSMRASFLRGPGHCTRIQDQIAAFDTHKAYYQVTNICAARMIHSRCAASSESVREGRRRGKEPGLICLNLLEYSISLLVISLSAQPLHRKPAETPEQPFHQLLGIHYDYC